MISLKIASNVNDCKNTINGLIDNQKRFRS